MSNSKIRNFWVKRSVFLVLAPPIQTAIEATALAIKVNGLVYFLAQLERCKF